MLGCGARLAGARGLGCGARLAGAGRLGCADGLGGTTAGAGAATLLGAIELSDAGEAAPFNFEGCCAASAGTGALEANASDTPVDAPFPEATSASRFTCTAPLKAAPDQVASSEEAATPAAFPAAASTGGATFGASAATPDGPTEDPLTPAAPGATAAEAPPPASGVLAVTAAAPEGAAVGALTAAAEADVVVPSVSLAGEAMGAAALAGDAPAAEFDSAELDAASVPVGAAVAALGGTGTGAGDVTEVRASAFTATAPATESLRAATEVGLVSNAFTNSAISPASAEGSTTAAARGPPPVADNPPSVAAKIKTSPTAPAPTVAVPGADNPTPPNPANNLAPTGLRNRASSTTRKGCRPLNAANRTFNCGSSANTVPTPVITAEHRARHLCTSARAGSPVIH